MQIVIRRLSAEGSVDQPFEGNELILGRGTDASIMLPGLLVALRHARITQSSQYLLKVESLCPMGVEVNDLTGVQSADLQVGDVLRIGGHRLRLSVDGESLVLELELADTDNALARSHTRTGLAEAGLRMRRPAMWLLLLTLLLGFVLPLALRYVRPPEAVAAFLPTDRLWLTNDIDNSHQHFGADCGRCHETLFVPVRDGACVSCHRGVKQHSDDPAIASVEGIEGRRCASCHREHQGAHGVKPTHPGICTDCHAMPQFADFPDLKPARDFGNAHPEFGSKVVREGRLIFPHDVHLREGGVRGADGLEQLDCASCHARNRGEAHFQPVAFAPHCQRCHQLDVDLAGNPVRLPHGDSELARAALLTYAKVLPRGGDADEAPSRKRPGEAAPRGGEVGAGELIDDVIENRVCAKCHETVREPGKAVAVRAPQLGRSWLAHAQFTHDAHAWQSCDDCHARQGSATADDLSLPAIASCRNCHGGVNSADRLQSTCIDCHRFHEASKLVMGALADGAGPSAAEQEQ